MNEGKNISETQPIDDGGPAFPVTPPLSFSAGYSEDSAAGYPYPARGMTLRDYFAAAALPQVHQMLRENGAEFILAEANRHGISTEDLLKGPGVLIARLCYEVADAMLQARKAKP